MESRGNKRRGCKRVEKLGGDCRNNMVELAVVVEDKACVEFSAQTSGT